MAKGKNTPKNRAREKTPHYYEALQRTSMIVR
jgi:hypothetical protein